jgi:putative colanic acid biosynthesis glycosyltransferase
MCLSIVTVSFNNLAGLKRTLDSIKGQNICHAEALEWIVIDGGSADGTQHFLQTLCLDFPFAFKSERDEGIFDAMNKGVKLSSGRFLLFLNSGDVFASEDVLKKLSIYLSAQPTRLVSGLVEMTYKKNTKIADLRPWVCHQSVFVPRALVEKYMFDDTLKFFGDLDLWKRLDKDGRFNLQRLDIIISRFELGGVGNSPDHIFKRLQERRLVGLRYGDDVPYFLRLTHSFFMYGVYRLAGRDAYFKFLLR